MTEGIRDILFAIRRKPGEGSQVRSDEENIFIRVSFDISHGDVALTECITHVREDVSKASMTARHKQPCYGVTNSKQSPHYLHRKPNVR